MSAEENKDIVRQFWGVWEEGNIDLVDELLAPDYINHTATAPDLPTGPEGGQRSREYVPERHA